MFQRWPGWGKSVVTITGHIGAGQSLMIGNSTLIISSSPLGSNVKLFDSKGLFWNPVTTYPTNQVIYPSDPTLGYYFKNLGASGTSANVSQPTWSHGSVGATTVDGTIVWTCQATSGASFPYDPTAPTSGTLSLVALTEPERQLQSDGGGGGAYQYANNCRGESQMGGFCEQMSVLAGGVHAPHMTGRGAATVAQLKKGGTSNNFAAGIFEVKAYMSPASGSHGGLAAAKFGVGSKYKCGSVQWQQGEANATDPPTTYANSLVQMQSDYQNDVFAETGQAGTLYLFASQQHSTGGSMLLSASGSMQGALDASVSTPQVVCYGGQYNCEQTDGTHMTAGSYRRIGIKRAQLTYQTVNQSNRWVPLQPTSIVVSGTTVTITFNVPVGNLQFDANAPNPHQSGTYSDAGQGGTSKGWTSGKGFELYTAAGGVQGIVSTVLSGSNQVVITANASDIGYVGYAAVADASPPSTGAYVRGGQLCDQDTFQGYDKETLTCNVTNGSARISYSPTSKFDVERTLHDQVTGSGFAAGTEVLSRAGGTGTLDLSNNWTGSTGTSAITIWHNMKNYCAAFQVQVGSASSVAAFEFPASTAGSVSRIKGSGFIGSTVVGAAIPKVWIANPGGAIIAQLSVTYISSTCLEVTGIPSLAAGMYDLQIQNPYDAIVTFSNAITSTSTDTFLSVMGLGCVGLLMGNSLSQSGGNVSQVNDQSNRGNDFVDGGVGGHPVTYTASSANANGQPTFSMDGSSYLKNAAFNHAVAAGNAIWQFLVVKMTTPGSTTVFIQYNPTAYEGQLLNTGVPRWTAPTATWGSSATGSMKAMYMGRVAGLAGTTNNSFFSVDNGTETTSSASYASSMQTSANATIGARNGGTLGTVMEVACVGWCNRYPTSGERTKILTWARGLFGVGI